MARVTALKLSTANPDEARRFCEGIRKNPVAWMYKLFGLNLWRGPEKNLGQADLLEGIFWETEGVAPSGHTLGKTQLCQYAPALWLLAHPYSYVVILGASWDSVRDHIMRGMGNVQRLQPFLLPGKPTLTSWFLEPDWGVVAKSPREIETIQGYHSRGKEPFRDLMGTLVLVDEASKLEIALYTSIKSLVGGENHFWMLGNPLNPDGPMADAIRDSSVPKVHLDGYNSPNYCAGRTLKGFEGLFGVAEEKMWRKRCGGDVNSAEYLARVRGILPDQSLWQLIPRSWVTAALERDEAHHISPEDDGELVLAVDVAESPAGDETVLGIRGVTTVHFVEGVLGLTSPDLIRRVDQLVADFPGIRRICVDASGIGSTLVEHLREKRYPGVEVVAVVSQQTRGIDTIRYANWRAQCWGTMKEAFDPANERALRIPKAFIDLLMQVTYVRFQPDGTRIRMELKKEVRKRIDASPDYADMLAYSFAEPVGESAFPMVNPKVHRQPQAPQVQPGDPRHHEYRLHRPWLPAEYDTTGYLCRATWLSDVEKSATVWLHVDQTGGWTVYDAVALREPVGSYWEMISQRHPRHDYTVDVFSARQHPFKKDMHNEYLDAMYGIDGARVPLWVPPKSIAGAAGVSEITMMLLASLACFPKDAYWKGTGIDARLHARSEFLWIWPEDMVQALKVARRMNPATGDEQTELDEGLVNDGGPLVRALRLLVVAGAGR